MGGQRVIVLVLLASACSADSKNNVDAGTSSDANTSSTDGFGGRPVGDTAGTGGFGGFSGGFAGSGGGLVGTGGSTPSCYQLESVGGRPGYPFGVPAWSPTSPVMADGCTTPTALDAGPDAAPESIACCQDPKCGPKESCLHVLEFAKITIGGPDYETNSCFALCGTDDDCTAPEVCVGDIHGLMVCTQVGCRSDADCQGDRCGVCVDGYVQGHAGAVHADPSNSICAYAGGCTPDSCEGCGADGNWHYCSYEPAPLNAATSVKE